VIRACADNYDLDILVVNDGSTDNTAKIIDSLKTSPENRLYTINHPRNMGKGQALKTGFDFAVSGNYHGVVTIDADGQHRTDEIRNFLKTIDDRDPDIIVGSRFGNTRGMPFIRLATNFFTSWIISVIAGKKINDVQSGFRYISKKVLETVKLETANFDTEPEILLKAGWADYDIVNIPISTIYHKNFVSHVNPLTDTIKFFRLVFKSLGWKLRFRRSNK
jgi:glycosyltransferase involved in cell wall biosynthesis